MTRLIHSPDFIHRLARPRAFVSYPAPSVGGMFEGVPDAAVVATIGDSARAENIACAKRLAAVAELYERRQIPVEDGKSRELWRIDPWAAVATEVAAVQGITTAAASAAAQCGLPA